MTLSSTQARVRYLGDDAADRFDYTFRILAAGDLTVVRTDASGVQTALTLDSDYSVDGVGDPNGGSVTLTGGALPAGETLTLARRVALVQETDLTNQGAFYAEVHEDAFDRLTMIDQQQQDEIGRSLRFPLSDPTELTAELPAAAARAGRVAAYDYDGLPTVSALTVAGLDGFAEIGRAHV